MKIYVNQFIHNDTNLKFEDVIREIKGKKDENGIITIHLVTKDKYLNVRADSILTTTKYSGHTIEIRPYIIGVEEEEGTDEYYNHPNYFYLELVVNATDNGYYFANITNLKHETFVNFIPHNMMINYHEFEDVELIHDN